MLSACKRWRASGWERWVLERALGWGLFVRFVARYTQIPHVERQYFDGLALLSLFRVGIVCFVCVSRLCLRDARRRRPTDFKPGRHHPCPTLGRPSTSPSQQRPDVHYELDATGKAALQYTHHRKTEPIATLFTRTIDTTSPTHSDLTQVRRSNPRKAEGGGVVGEQQTSPAIHHRPRFRPALQLSSPSLPSPSPILSRRAVAIVHSSLTGRLQVLLLSAKGGRRAGLKQSSPSGVHFTADRRR